MAASVHNFILTYGELNTIAGLLHNAALHAPDENSRNTLAALHTKMREQRDSGYPARDYPFWRNYFEDTGVVID